MSEHLPDRMRQLATTHARGPELVEKADALDKELESWGSGNPMRLLGKWAQARKLWCECTGEDLV